MTQDLDDNIGKLLREGDIPERDPLFRIRVIERCERQRFRRRSRAVVAGAVVVATVPAIALMLDNPIVVGLAVLLCAAAIAASIGSVRSMLRVARWLRAA